MRPQRLSKSNFQIPESVVEDILSKLPVKSLLRFRCVCKPWYLSLQTPQFIAQHHRNSLENNNPNLLVKPCRENPEAADVIYLSVLSVQQEENYFVSEKIDLPFYCERFAELTVVCGPSNGVFCLQVYEELVLWNPSTREFKMLPKSTCERPQGITSSILNCLRFGFDSRTCDYKVVRFFTIGLFTIGSVHWSSQVELYSLKSDSWKEIPFRESIPQTSHLLNHDLNGVFYWEVGEILDGHILSFDMANEKFSVLPLPKFGKLDESLGGYEWHLLDFNGKLGVIVHPREVADKSMIIWVMDDSWTKLFSVEAIPGIEKPLGLWKNGRMFFENSSNELVLFDPVTREFKNLGIRSHPGIMQVITYAESLVPINGRSEEKEGVFRQQVGI